MTQAVEKRRYTIAEYLALEEKAVGKHEFRDGEILAMSGGTYNHSVATMNIGAALVQRLKGKSCRPLDSNMRVRMGETAHYCYPDVSVVCGSPQFDPADQKKTTILNPTLIVEVQSPSTADYDRQEKFDGYRQIESLREYVLVSQDSPRIETFYRQDDGSWTFNTSVGLSGVMRLRSLEIDLPLGEVYSGVDFPPPGTPDAQASD